MNRALRSDGLARALPLFLLTLLSMFWVGAAIAGEDVLQGGLRALGRGYTFALPLMAILLAHEFGHFIAARIHGVETSLPYFIPMPFALIGTFGAVMRMNPTRERNALFDIGAAGPLAGLAVALPVLIYGVITSPVETLDPKLEYLVEGRSLLYLGLLAATKGPIPEGQDITLTPTAFAGWAGLLVTMINLVPVGQLDGGHVAYALFGPRQAQYSRRFRWLLVAVGLTISAVSALRAQYTGGDVVEALQAGFHWLMWSGVLAILSHVAQGEHPPVEPGELTPVRRALAWMTLGLFVLLFMPTWVSTT